MPDDTVQGTDNQEGQEPETQPQEPTLDVTAMEKELAKVRREAAKWRTQLRKFEEAEEERKRAQMSELEKAQTDLAALTKQLGAERQERQRIAMRSQVLAAASKAGMHDPEDAWKNINADDLELDGDNTIQGLDKAISKLAESKPYLFKGQTQPGVTPTNPSAAPQKKSDAQRLAELLHGPGRQDFWEGGGIVWAEKDD